MYHPIKLGHRISHPLVVVGAGKRLSAAFQFRNGDTVTTTQLQAAMEDARANLGGRQLWLNRGDLRLRYQAIMAWY